MKREAEQAVADRRKASEERKLQKQALEVQWRLDFNVYTIKEGAWRVECAAIMAEWQEARDQARIAHKRPPKKPDMPAKPKRPIKPKEAPVAGQNAEEAAEAAEEAAEEEEAGESDIEAELADRVGDLELDFGFRRAFNCLLFHELAHSPFLMTNEWNLGILKLISTLG